MNVSSSIAMAFVEKYLVVSTEETQGLVGYLGLRSFIVNNEEFLTRLESGLRENRLLFDSESFEVIVTCHDPRLMPVKPDGHVVEFPFSGGITFHVRAGPKYITFQLVPGTTAGRPPAFYEYFPDEGIWSSSWMPDKLATMAPETFHIGLVDAILQYFKMR